MTNDEIKKDLKNKLKPSRYEHSIGVAYTAACLAMRYGYDVNKAYRAGLLHDCTKYMDGRESLEFCENNNISVTDIERSMPQALLHSKTGAFMAKAYYKEEDSEVLDSILTHTTGDVNMTLLQKIIFIADFIEPNRKSLPMMDSIREIAFTDIDRCVLAVYESVISYLHENPKNGEIDPKSVNAYEYYKKLCDKK